MTDRRAFLKRAGAGVILAPWSSKTASAALASRSVPESTSTDHQGWKPAWIKQADGNSRWILHSAQIRFLDYTDGKTPYYDGKFLQLMPFGVERMDNHELALIGAVSDESKKWPRRQDAVITFSQDGGESWAPLRKIDESDGCYGRP